MADRSVSVTLRANVQDFKTQIGQAASSLDDLAKKGDKTGQASQTVMGRVTQSMQLQREQWTTAGVALTGFGAAITGVGVAALNTGINYNTLQQTSRAALTTLTGSAEKANAQMDKLDAFAAKSPFAKDVFIKAQQQMLGFGIEAQKVIPFLDAIQQSVAATGGSNEDISELTRIFSQVQAAAKITATDLMQFGQRGIDAASLIGSQMGKTGAQIREEITAGTLDAGVALDALAAGMQAKYGGAADNVKATVTGAFDRVKAAWRDLSGDLASPLVGPEGGGLLVGLLNQTADLMRSFDALPGPIKNTVAALGGLTGAGSLAAGGFLLLAPRVMDSVVAFKALRDLHLVEMAGGISGVAKAVGKFAFPVAAFAGVMALADFLNGADSWEFGEVEDLADALLEVTRHGETASDALTKIGSTSGDIGRFTNEISTMQELLDELAPSFEKAFGDSTLNKIERFADSPGNPVGKATEKIQLLDEAFAQMASSGHVEEAMEGQAELYDLLIASGMSADEAAASFTAFDAAIVKILESGEALPGVLKNWEGVREAMGGGAPMQLPDGSTVWDFADATGAAADETERLATEEERLASIWDAQVQKIQDVINARLGLNNEARTAQDLELAWASASEGMVGALADESVALNEARDGWNLRTDAGEAAYKATRDYADVMRDTAIAEWERTGSIDAVQAALEPIADEYRAQAEELGLSGEALERYMSDMGLIPAEVATKFTVDADSWYGEIEGIWAEWDGKELTVNGDTTPLTATVAETLGLIADGNGEVTILGDTYPAETTWQQFLDGVDTATPTAGIYGDDAQARGVLHQLMNDVDVSYDAVNIGGDDGQGRSILSRLMGDIGASRGDVLMGGDDTIGRGVLSRFGTTIRTTREDVRVGADTSLGESIFAGMLGRMRSQSVTIPVRAGSVGGPLLGALQARAKGGYTPPGWTLVGEEGPEIVNFSAPNRVYTAAETARVFSAQQGNYVSARSASPVVNVSAPSMAGLQVVGDIRIGDAIIPLMNAQIVAADRKKQIVGRRP